MIVASSHTWEIMTEWGLSIGHSALLRSLLIGVLAVFLSPPLAAWVTQHQRHGRRYALGAALAPMFAPPLMVGYCYSTGLFLLVHQPLANAAFYSLLLLLKTVPAGMLVMLFAPGSPVSPTAFHCHRVLPSRAWQKTVQFWLLGPLYHRLAVFTVCFLVSYQEFETASLMSVPGWTVDIFDAQAMGIRPVRTMQVLSLPLMIMGATVLTTVSILTRGTRRSADREEWGKAGSRWPGDGLVLTANLLLWGVPLLKTGSALPGSAVLLNQSTMLAGFVRELSSALGFAFCGATLTVVTALFLLRNLIRNRSSFIRGLVLAMLIPGLSGALSVTLCLFLAVQSGPLTSLRTTPFPAVIGMAVFLLPRAVLMLVLFERSSPDAAVFSASTLSQSADGRQMSGGFRVLWQLQDRALFWTFAAVFIWGFYNLTTASLLMPVAIVPLPVRLYNLMHYGQSASLSMQTLLSVVIPFLLMSGTVFAVPHLQRLVVRSTSRDRPESGPRQRTKSSVGK